MRINILGAGYVGQVTGYCLSKWHDVSLVDSSLRKIHEPGLSVENLKFSTTPPKCDVTFICVGTPDKDGSCDLSYVEQACGETNGIKIIKSTVPPGTCKRLGAISNPEFLQEGSAVHNFLYPDRIVIGCGEEYVGLMSEIYKGIDAPILFTDSTTSELIKYASNSFLATKLAFINELWGVAEKYGADISTVTKGMGMDKRIGARYLKVGPGFGGSCFPKDLKEISKDLPIAKYVLESNESHKRKIVDKIMQSYGSIGILGTAFKANTDDVRESPAMDIVNILLSNGRQVKTYDPQAKCSATLEECLQCDVVAILTEWDEFRNIQHPQLMDFRLNP